MASGLTPLLVSVSAVAAVGAAAALYSAWVQRRFQGLAEAWRRYAAAAGMQYVPPPALRPEAGPSIHGEVQGVAVIVALHETTGAGMTRVEAPLPGGPERFSFAIFRRAALGGGRPERDDLVETITGNKVFDGEFALYSNEPDAARSILDRRLAQVIGAFPKGFDFLFVEENRLSIIWAGMETDSATLDAAIQVVWTACRRRA